nr:ribonuclease H-like domain-containing protein [Tanacetum cinerariifolium]
DNAGQARKETEPIKYCILLPLWTADPPFSQDPKSSNDGGFKPLSDDGKKVDEDPRKENKCKDQEKKDNVNNTNNVNNVGNVNTVSTVNVAGTDRVNVVDENRILEMKGILRQFSVARTPQQNGVAKRRNKTLIKAARTLLADSKLPTTFWAEAVNIACYVQNRVLVVKPHNKILYELFHGRTPTLSFMRPFWCPVTILNTIDHLGKFNGKADEGQARKETEPVKYCILLPLWTADPPFSQDPKRSNDGGFKPLSGDGKKVDEDPRKENECKDQEKKDNVNNTNNVNNVGNVNTVSTVNAVGTDRVNVVDENR